VLSRVMAKAKSSPLPPRNVEARIEPRPGFSFATKASVLPANVLSADPAPSPGKSEEVVPPATYTLPWPSRAMAKAASALLPPRNVEARIELRPGFSFATKPSEPPANVLSADPAPTPGKSEEVVPPATYTLPALSIIIAKAKSSPLPPRNVAARIELRPELSSTTKPSSSPANVLSAEPEPIPGKSDAVVTPATYTFPVLSRVMLKACSPLLSFPPRNVAARIELKSGLSFAIKASLSPRRVLWADPAPIPGKFDENVAPATYTFPWLSKVIAKATSSKGLPLPPKNVEARTGSITSSFSLS